MWKVRTKILQVIIGALGTIKQRLDQTLSSVRPPVGHRAEEDQLMSTAHSIRKVLE
jgi:hypothetical protein